jgi:hypothetical protein
MIWWKRLPQHAKTDFNDAERHYSCAILQAPFPVDGYGSPLRVHSL